VTIDAQARARTGSSHARAPESTARNIALLMSEADRSGVSLKRGTRDSSIDAVRPPLSH
jgi:hypothetical protein